MADDRAPHVRTVAYGDQPDQVLDLWTPPDSPPSGGWPVAVLVHGGFWREKYRRDLMDPAAADLAELGLAVANVEYRRVGAGGGWPDTLSDVARAVDSLAARGPAALDLERVGMIGHSAGGHLALWLTGRDRLPPGAVGANPLVRPAVTIALAPVADLAGGASHLGDGAVLEFLGGDPRQHPQRYAVADPMRLVGHGRRVVLIHGEADESVPLEQSAAYHRAAVSAGDPVTRRVVAGDHMDVIAPATPAWAAVLAALNQELDIRP